MGAEEASHHDTETLDLRLVKRLSVLLFTPAIGGLEAGPRDADALRLAIVDDKVILVARGCLLAAVALIWREKQVFDNQRVSLTIRLVDDQLDAIVLGQIPGPVFVGGAVARESGAAERLDVEVAVKSSDAMLGFKVGFGLASSYAIVAGGPTIARPRPV